MLVSTYQQTFISKPESYGSMEVRTWLFYTVRFSLLNNTIKNWLEAWWESFQSCSPFQRCSLSTLQSFFSRLAFAMFSCRFCFFFCSFSLASIILANFQDSTALARNSGVSAKITVVRKPYGSFAAHSTTYSAQAFTSSIFAASKTLGLGEQREGGKKKKQKTMVNHTLYG